MIQQQQNHLLGTDNSRSHRGLQYILRQNLALYSAVIKTQKHVLFSTHGGVLVYVMYHHRETINQINLL